MLRHAVLHCTDQRELQSPQGCQANIRRISTGDVAIDAAFPASDVFPRHAAELRIPARSTPSRLGSGMPWWIIAEKAYCGCTAW